MLSLPSQLRIMSPQNRSEAELIEDKFYKRVGMVILAVKFLSDEFCSTFAVKLLSNHPCPKKQKLMDNVDCPAGIEARRKLTKIIRSLLLS